MHIKCSIAVSKHYFKLCKSVFHELLFREHVLQNLSLKSANAF